MKRYRVRFTFVTGFAFSFLFFTTQSFAATGLSKFADLSRIIEEVATSLPNVGPPIFSVAPFHTNDPSNDSGAQIQNKIQDLMKTIWPNAISKKILSSATDAKNAQDLLEVSGVDWLLWGTQETAVDGSIQWTYGICTSERFKNLMKQMGFSQSADVIFQHVPDADLNELVKFSLESSTQLCQTITGKQNPDQFQKEIVESDELLDSIQKNGLDPELVKAIKGQQALLLNIYGLETNDFHSRKRAEDIYKELIQGETDPKSEKSHGYEMGLGFVEMQLGKPVEAVEAFEAALNSVDPVASPLAWADTETQLGTAHISAGSLIQDKDDVSTGAQELESALLKVDKKTQLLRWIGVQNALGLAYQALGLGETDDKSYKLSSDHFLEVLRSAKGVLKPDAIATLESSLASDYSAMGMHERNVDYLNQAVITAKGAVETCRTLKNNLLLANALIHVAQADNALVAAQGDISSLQLAKAALEEGQKICPPEEGKRIMIIFPLMIAQVDRTLAACTIDSTLLKEALQLIQQAKEMDPSMLERNPAFPLQESDILEYEAILECNDSLFDEALKDADEGFNLATAEKNDAMVISAKMNKAAIEDVRGCLNHDPALLHDSITILESVLDDFTKTDQTADSCSALSAICDAYNDLLQLEATPLDISDAKSILERFKGCQKAAFPGEEASHMKCEAEITYGLASHTGDADQLNRALSLCQQALAFFQQSGDINEQGNIEQLLGKIDTALFNATKKTEFLLQASSAFTTSNDLLKNYGSCVRADSNEGLKKIKSLMGGQSMGVGN